jgi:hypothetical protein
MWKVPAIWDVLVSILEFGEGRGGDLAGCVAPDSCSSSCLILLFRDSTSDVEAWLVRDDESLALEGSDLDA